MVGLPVRKREKNSFFSEYPNFHFDPLATFTDDFNRLGQERNWSYRSRHWKKQWIRCVKAEYHCLMGTDRTTFEKWEKICLLLDFEGIYSIRQAKKVLSQVHVNLIDLLETWKGYRGPKMFSSVRELAQYSLSTGKICPREAAKVGPAFRVLMKDLL